MLFSESQGGPVLLSSLPSARQSTGALGGGDKSAALCRVPRALPKAASRTTLDSPLVADSAPSRVPTLNREEATGTPSTPRRPPKESAGLPLRNLPEPLGCGQRPR